MPKTKSARDRKKPADMLREVEKLRCGYLKALKRLVEAKAGVAVNTEILEQVSLSVYDSLFLIGYVGEIRMSGSVRSLLFAGAALALSIKDVEEENLPKYLRDAIELGWVARVELCGGEKEEENSAPAQEP